MPDEEVTFEVITGGKQSHKLCNLVIGDGYCGLPLNHEGGCVIKWHIIKTEKKEGTTDV